MGQTFSNIVKCFIFWRKKFMKSIMCFETLENQPNSRAVLQHEQILVDFSELNEDEEEGNEVNLSRGVVINERWKNHYSNCHSILLVDEGDFSFSNSLAMDFGSTTNMIATSLDGEENQANSPAVLQHEQISVDFSELSEDEEEGNKLNLSRGVVINERWKNHYSNCHKILLVGEGDFSFSNSLAMAFGSATNMIATSLNSEGFLTRNYRNAMSNIQNLRNRGCMVVNGVDATQMANYFWLMGLMFDRVVFNFPHAGFFQNESCSSQLSRHRTLIQMFLENAKKMIMNGGEIHITHKSNRFFRQWNLEFLASECGLQLVEEEHFNFREYPGYHTKYGFGGDKNFKCNPSKTYKFGLAFGIPNY